MPTERADRPAPAQLEQLGRQVRLPRRASADHRGVPGQVVAGLPDSPELGDGAGISDGPKGLDGLVAKIDLRKVLDRLGVSVAETVPPQEGDELELAREVGFFVKMRPEGARGLVAVDSAQRSIA